MESDKVYASVRTVACALGVTFAVAGGPSLATAAEGPAPASYLAGTDWESVGKRYRLDPALLYAIALVESKRFYPKEHAYRPHPWALRTPGGPKFPEDAAQAMRLLEAMDRKTLEGTDVGMMQVNLFWNGHRVASPADLLDPLTNLNVAAGILSEAIDTAPNDLELGIGRYHSYKPAQAREYGREVIAVWARLRQPAEARIRKPR